MTKSFIENLARFVTTWPKTTILLSLLPCLLLMTGASHIEWSQSPRKFQGEDSPGIRKLIALEEKYVEDNSIVVMFQPAGDTVFTPSTLAAIERFTDAAWQIPHIKRVDSLANFQYSHAEDDNLFIENLISNGNALTAEEVEKIQQTALNDPRVTGLLVAKDGHTAGAILTFSVDLGNAAMIRELEQALAELRTAIEQEFPDITTFEAGYTSMIYAWDRSAKQDLKLLYPFSVLAIFAGLVLFLRNIRASLAALLLGMLATLAGVCSSAYIGNNLTGLTLMGALLILMLGLADAVHITITASRNLANGQSQKQAIIDSLSFNFSAVALTSLTTAIGFLTFQFSGTDSVVVMGRYVAVGVVVAFLLSITLLPALLCYCNLQPRKAQQSSTRYTRLANLVIRHRNTLLLLIFPLFLLSIYLVHENDLNDGLALYVNEGDIFRQHKDIIEKEFTGTATITYDLISPSDNGVNDPDYLKKMDAFARYLRQQPEVHHVSSFSDTLIQLNYNLHDDDPAWHTLPDSPELAAQYILLYELSLPFGLDLTNQLDINKTSSRVLVVIDDIPIMRMLALADRVDQWFVKNAPELRTEANGGSIVTSRMGLQSIINMVESSILALVVIGLVLLFTFRSILPGVMSIIMIIAPILAAFSVWALTVGYVGVPASVSICMVIGIVVDNAVHFLSKYLYAQRELHQNAEDSVRYAFEYTGDAIVSNAAILSAGFFLLFFSAFGFNTVMGQLTVLSLGFSLFGTFTLLPALLLSTNNLLERLWPSRFAFVEK